jgi:hypothetical protein
VTRARAAAPLVVALLGAAAPAAAFDIPLPAPFVLRFDNTLRYNLGLRTDPINEKLGANPAFTAGEYSFKQWGFTASRLDLLSELDFSWNDQLGLRVTAAAWYDLAYASGDVHRSPALVAAGIPGSYVNDRYSDYTLHRYRGPWGELLDAFAFARVDAWGVPVTVKVGRHALSWGESLMLGGALHSVSYAQVPLDLQKGFATPGVEAKELFRPVANVSVQAQVAPSLSLAAQYFLEWQSYLYPEGGTFLGGGDFAFKGPDGVYRNQGGTPIYIVNGYTSEPDQVGEWGVAVRWAPGWLDGTLGLYYRRYTDKFAAILLTGNPGATGPLSPALPSPLQYRLYYGEGVDLFGLSFAKQVLGFSLGAEASYRYRTPLLSQTLGFAVAPSPAQAPLLFPHGAPTLVGNSYQARGDTLHALLNAVGVSAELPGMSALSWAVELTWSHWLTVRDNPDMFYGVGYGVCRSDPALMAAGLYRSVTDGCATRDHVGFSVGLTPTWLRVASGIDLLAPLALSWTVYGNSPVSMGGNEGSGTYSIGVAADIVSRWRIDLRYVDFFGTQRDTGPVVTSFNGVQALLSNRGSVMLTAKVTL